VEAVQVRLICVGETPAPERLVGVVGGVVSDLDITV
jgi:hypothetical protein